MEPLAEEQSHVNWNQWISSVLCAPMGSFPNKTLFCPSSLQCPWLNDWGGKRRRRLVQKRAGPHVVDRHRPPLDLCAIWEMKSEMRDLFVLYKECRDAVWQLMGNSDQHKLNFVNSIIEPITRVKITDTLKFQNCRPKTSRRVEIWKTWKYKAKKVWQYVVLMKLNLC